MPVEPKLAEIQESPAKDPQRYLVYAAEEDAAESYGEEKLNPVTIQMLARDIQTSVALGKLYPDAMRERFKIVLKGNTRTSAYFFLGTIFLPKWAHNNWTVCHEIAHLIDRRQNGVVGEGHGSMFCGILINVVREVISPKAADVLMNYYTSYGVDFSSKTEE